MRVQYTNIPLWDHDSQEWTRMSFETQEDFGNYLEELLYNGSNYLSAGNYGFDECSLKWNEFAKKFDKTGVYCDSPKGSKDYKDFWDFERKKCRLGVFYRYKGNTWYLTRDYYFLLNYCPISNKEKGNRITFVDVRDTQYIMALYEKVADIKNLHSCLVKKRQMLSSYYHAAKLYNVYVFEETANIKMLASTENYINNSATGTWRILNSYRDFINRNTHWYRANNPDKEMSWQQRVKVKEGGREYYSGNMSTLTGIVVKTDPAGAAGGNSFYIFYEEAGIAPTLKEVFGYAEPALKAGALTTGSFLAAGSVGDLKQCEGLRDYIEAPVDYGFYAVRTDLVTPEGDTGIRGLFIPEQWGRPPYIDKFGNSLVKEALEDLTLEEAKWRKLPANEFRLKKSQHPRYLSEAFDYREDGYFQTDLIQKKQDRIRIAKPNILNVKLLEESNGSVKCSVLENGNPIIEYPIKTHFKEGCVQVLEKPNKEEPEKFTYFAGVDPVATDITNTSESLFAIYIWKTLTEKSYWDEKDEVVRKSIEGFKPVAWYVGRYDSLKETHKVAELLIRWYNAHALVESNVTAFIDHMKQQGLRHMLATKDEVSFTKDLGINSTTNREFGVYNSGDGKLKQYMLSIMKDYIGDEVDVVRDNDNNVIRKVYGVDAIEDLGLLEELKQYRKGKNTDRLIAASLGLALMKNYVNIGVYNKEVEERVSEPTGAIQLRKPGGYFGRHVYKGEKNTIIAPRKSFFKGH